ncbi:MAG: hypothetical protein K5780_03250 [Alphaproteobacteria bacterium]|nr:hypothetical protein [Alphaproteobacteria bacterium]
MSFFSNTVKLIKNRHHKEIDEQNVSPDVELNFSLRNYAKESFSVLIAKPLSNYFMKFTRIVTFIITGGIIGTLLSVIAFVFFMQFGSIENKFISLFIDSKINDLFPDSDLIVKSAKLSWNSEKHAPEISIKKLKLDDLVIPSISIFPNIMESIKRQKFVTDSVNISGPKINLRFSDDFKISYFDPNFERSYNKSSLSESTSVLNGFKKLLNNFGDLKIVNADVTIEENGVLWKLSNAYCHYVIGDELPCAMSFKIKLPDQDYFSTFNIVRTVVGDTDKYIANVDSCNPRSLREVLLKRNSPLNNPIINSLLENNLPVSGLIHFDIKNNEILKGDFDLIGSAGSIKIPAKTSISLNLGKTIDNGSISGTFNKNGIDINSLNVNYGDASIQLTGISIPMVEYNLMDMANIDGTLSLTNVGISEMSSLLPENFSKSIVPSFRNYMPGFKLGLFKVDLKGAVPFGKRNVTEPMSVGNGVFKLSEAQVPLGKTIIDDVEAVGTITNDGFDIKLSNARLNETRINRGEFFISSKDNSWIGTINADVSTQEVKKYAADISQRLGSLHIDNLNIGEKANIDMKLVRISGDDLSSKSLPFRIVEGNGILKSSDNTKQVKFSWNDTELNVSGDVSEGKDNINLVLEENFKRNEGTAEFKFKSESDFLKGMLPGLEKIFSGDYSLNLNMGWKGDVTQYVIDADLENSLLNFPTLGDLKLRHTPGNLKAKILLNNDVLDISELSIDTADNKINGNVVVGKNGLIYKAAFNDFMINGNTAKLNIVRNNLNALSVSIIGKRFNTNLLNKVCKVVPGNENITCYLNLDELMVEDAFPVKNVKGSLNIRNGKIINGACYGVIGKDTTLALTAQPNTTSDDSIVSLSVSNAGEFLKYFKFIDGINGGTLNIVLKNSIISDSSMSGAFELNDFVAKNDKLTRLISFSSMNGISNTDSYSVGFNFCLGSFVFADNLIKIEKGKALGPTVGISYSGTYNRLEDKLDLVGVSLLISSIVSSKGTNGAYAAPYKLIGSIANPIMSVKPLQFVTNEAISEVFGNMIPIISTENYPVMETLTPVSETVDSAEEDTSVSVNTPKEKDPFANKAFDKSFGKVTTQKAKPKARKSKAKPKSEKKYGVTINRGKSRR